MIGSVLDRPISGGIYTKSPQMTEIFSIGDTSRFG